MKSCPSPMRTGSRCCWERYWYFLIHASWWNAVKRCRACCVGKTQSALAAVKATCGVWNKSVTSAVKRSSTSLKPLTFDFACLLMRWSFRSWPFKEESEWWDFNRTCFQINNQNFIYVCVCVCVCLYIYKTARKEKTFKNKCSNMYCVLRTFHWLYMQ